MKRKPVLLNVDDHEAARFLRSAILTEAGFEVLDAGSGEETIAMVERYRPDLVLLDVHLPDMGSVEVCRRLKAAQPGHSVMVIQISVSSLSASRATAALDAGADAYLMEPVDREVLIATVKAMLRLHEAEQLLAHAMGQLEVTNKELRRSNEDLQQFAFAASHDLQEPLRAIAAFSQLLQLELNGTLSVKHNEYFTHVLRGGERMRFLIRDLLAYSQVGREDRPSEIVDLKAVIRWAVANLEGQIREADAIVTIEENPGSALGDFAHLGLVFQNLLSNALKYRDPGRAPVIHIEVARTSPAEWSIRVTDNGLGIASQYLERVFEPFKRLHGAEIPGTGIGLALCRRIVETLGGKIWVESTVDKGSVFCLTLNAG